MLKLPQQQYIRFLREVEGCSYKTSPVRRVSFGEQPKNLQIKKIGMQ